MKKIFFGSFPSNTSKTEVKKFFSEFGRVKNIDMKYDKSQKFFKGYGNVKFRSEIAAERILKQDIYFKGRRILVKKWKNGNDLIKCRQNVIQNRIFILSIPKGISDEEILHAFNRKYRVESAFRVNKEGNKTSYGYATFVDLNQKLQCLKKGHIKLANRKVLKCVDFDLNKKNKKKRRSLKIDKMKKVESKFHIRDKKIRAHSPDNTKKSNGLRKDLKMKKYWIKPTLRGYAHWAIYMNHYADNLEITRKNKKINNKRPY